MSSQDQLYSSGSGEISLEAKGGIEALTCQDLGFDSSRPFGEIGDRTYLVRLEVLGLDEKAVLERTYLGLTLAQVKGLVVSYPLLEAPTAQSCSEQGGDPAPAKSEEA